MFTLLAFVCWAAYAKHHPDEQAAMNEQGRASTIFV
jgi:hypothetical protein